MLRRIMVGAALALLARAVAGAHTRSIAATCGKPHPRHGYWMCVAGGTETAHTFGKTFSYDFDETDQLMIGETLISRVLWSGGVNFDGRTGITRQSLRLLVGAKIRTTFYEDVFATPYEVVALHHSQDPYPPRYAVNTAAKPWTGLYLHRSHYEKLQFQVFVAAEGAADPSTENGLFPSEAKASEPFGRHLRQPGSRNAGHAGLAARRPRPTPEGPGVARRSPDEAELHGTACAGGSL
jgi:hypothetical protein